MPRKKKTGRSWNGWKGRASEGRCRLLPSAFFSPLTHRLLSRPHPRTLSACLSNPHLEILNANSQHCPSKLNPKLQPCKPSKLGVSNTPRGTTGAAHPGGSACGPAEESHGRTSCSPLPAGGARIPGTAGGRAEADREGRMVIPHNLHPPKTLHPTPNKPNPTPHNLNLSPHTPNPESLTPNFKPSALNRKP